MPSTKQRKESPSALERFRTKYEAVDKIQHPFRLFPPIKKDTAELKELMETRNYIRIMTQVDDCKYIVVQYYIYCDADIWLAGDSFTFNQNPDKKIWAKYMCSAAQSECICENEDSKSFLTVCPECHHILLAIKDTPLECKHCNFKIDHKTINDLPYAKLSCQLCPKTIGWENCQALNELIAEKLQNRSHIMNKKIKEILEDEQSDT